MAADDLLAYCKSLPKIELHAHLNGSISDSTMLKLLGRKRGRVSHLPEAWQTTIAKGQKRTLEECFQMFKIIHTVVDDEEAVSMVASDVVKEFAGDGVIYLELRSTPRANEASGMTKSSYTDAILKGIEDALTADLNITVRLLLSIDRRQSGLEAMDTVLLADEYKKRLDANNSRVRVLGIDLSGDPYAGDVAELLPALKTAKEKDLKLAMHLSEIPSRNDETLMLLRGVPLDRIGHGTYLHPDVGGTEEIVQHVASNRIPIEACLSSNLKTQTVLSIEQHHFRYWRERDHPLVLCTDDKGVFSTSLSEEYHLAAKHFGLGKESLQKLSVNAIDHLFEDAATKEELRKLFKS